MCTGVSRAHADLEECCAQALMLLMKHSCWLESFKMQTTKLLFIDTGLQNLDGTDFCMGWPLLNVIRFGGTNVQFTGCDVVLAARMCGVYVEGDTCIFPTLPDIPHTQATDQPTIVPPTTATQRTTPSKTTTPRTTPLTPSMTGTALITSVPTTDLSRSDTVETTTITSSYTDSDRSVKRSALWDIIIILGVVAFTAIVIALAVIVMCCCKKRRRGGSIRRRIVTRRRGRKRLEEDAISMDTM